MKQGTVRKFGEAGNSQGIWLSREKSGNLFKQGKVGVFF